MNQKIPVEVGAVRAFLYTVSVLMLAAGALAMAFLPRLAAGLLWFGVIGASLSGLIALGWLLQSATAGRDWPRLRTGHALILGGLTGLISGLGSGHWLELGWAALVIAAGGGFLFPPGRGHRQAVRRQPGPVRSPVSRRG